MKPSLNVRLSQHLALTPQLQQSIRLLQLSTLELHQEIEQMLETNPFIEVDEEAGPGPYDTLAAAGAATSSEVSAGERSMADEPWDGAADNVSAGDGEPGIDGIDFGSTARDDWENGTEREDFDGIRETPSSVGSSSSSNDGEDYDPFERSTAAPSLEDHLREQLRGMRLSDADRAAVLMLIDSLDENGYLADSPAEIAERLAGDDAEACEELRSRLQCALGWLQSLDPLGVGARDLADCLVLQLRQQPRSEAQMIAILICKHHLELLARRDWRKLMGATGADEELLKAAQALIRRCEPKPARPFARAEANIVVPDVIVQKAGRGWRVTLNPDVMPKLRINDLYAQALKQQRGPRGAARTGAGDGAPALGARLQEARWFMKNILQRFDTIQRVSQAIVERQKGFFSHGAIAMQPLVLREIADELGLHESTISRVTTAKYMSTPHGTFELKYFFGSSLNTEAGGNASSTAVRALIKQLVAAEDGVKPLSDSQLSEMLGEQGITVARRTVAKYREAMKIAPANLRRAL
ncbi:RNA polymerase factor sigma-54 [Rivibacter subsaxonicus]|uniref:RNA polymerase sigma-54 factor n=1 Tax=Rivibacter subsaxonicus TaxID=457575 RepID=A0A4Q7VX31_9BURK|nr:RNA polymerase factor sigma-54 [Rivibacter subsaxonicus]RZU01223.1 RNA polymerase RpoN-/SigL-like sigma 54 subunit [Rivibacter subsaxonicus]